MSEREHGVREDHSRPRPLHNILYLLPHLRLVAMNLAERAKLLVDFEGAFLEAEERILSERSALLAQLLPSRSVLSVAILFDHHGDELLLFFPRFEFFGCFFFHVFSLFKFAYANL